MLGMGRKSLLDSVVGFLALSCGVFVLFRMTKSIFRTANNVMLMTCCFVILSLCFCVMLKMCYVVMLRRSRNISVFRI